MLIKILNNANPTTMIQYLVTIFILVVYKHVGSFPIINQKPPYAKPVHFDLIILFESINCLKSLFILNLLHILK